MEHGFEKQGRKENLAQQSVEKAEYDEAVIRIGNVTLTFRPSKEKGGVELVGRMSDDPSGSFVPKHVLKEAFAQAAAIFKDKEKKLIRDTDKDFALKDIDEVIKARGGDPED